jgi:hypothetical protein
MRAWGIDLVLDRAHKAAVCFVVFVSLEMLTYSFKNPLAFSTGEVSFFWRRMRHAPEGEEKDLPSRPLTVFQTLDPSDERSERRRR